MIDEWCAGTNGRLIPLIIVQLWDAHLAAAEIRRNADRGCRAVTFSEIPPFLGFPSIHDADGYWDPFLGACEETGTVINMHIGSSSKMPSTSADAPPAVGSTLTYIVIPLMTRLTNTNTAASRIIRALFFCLLEEGPATPAS